MSTKKRKRAEVRMLPSVGSPDPQAVVPLVREIIKAEITKRQDAKVACESIEQARDPKVK